MSHLVYVAAFALDEGESLMTCFGGEQPDLATVEGVIPVREDPAVTLYNDVPEDKEEAALARLLSQTALSFVEPVDRAAWRTLPSSYVVCDDDRSLPRRTRSRSPRGRVPRTTSPAATPRCFPCPTNWPISSNRSRTTPRCRGGERTANSSPSATTERCPGATVPPWSRNLSGR